MEGLGTRLPDTLHLELDLEELHLKCKLCVGNSYSWSDLFLVHPLFYPQQQYNTCFYFLHCQRTPHRTSTPIFAPEPAIKRVQLGGVLLRV